MRRLIDRTREGGFEILHGHAAKAGALARVAPAGALRAVNTPHCYPFAAETSAARRAVFVAAQRPLARLTAATICVSMTSGRLRGGTDRSCRAALCDSQRV